MRSFSFNRSQWKFLAAGVFFCVLASHAQQLYFTNDSSGEQVSSYNSVAPPLAILRQPASQVAATGQTRAFSVVAQGAVPLQYQWQFNSNNIAGATSASLIISNIASTNFGAYRVIVSNNVTFVTSTNALLQLDSDNDGLPDAWEIAEFGNLTNRDGFQDYDSDGVSDRDEFLEGTDPKNFSSANPRIILYSDRGEVLMTPIVPFFTNGQTITFTGTPGPGQQFLGYIGTPLSGGPYYSMKTNPASLKFGTPGINGSQIVRAIFGLPIPFSLNVTNAWRIDQAGWYGQTNVTHDGVAAAQSARIFNGEQAIMEISNVVLASEGTITFWWKVDGTPQDYLAFARNNLTRTGAIGTNTDWQFRTYYLPAGANTVRWTYTEGGNEVSEYNGLTYAPADAGWVDQVSYAVWPNPAIDTDGDGLPDIWEYKYFDGLKYGPDDDPDLDGTPNILEYQDGTDPNSSASLLPRLTSSTFWGAIARTPDLPKYTLGQTVQIQAVPDPTNYFVMWGGAVSGTNTTNSILMNGNRTVTALFGLPLGYVLDAPALAWSRGGPIGFFGQTNFSYDGLHSAESGPVGFHQESTLDTSVAGPGTLIFWWRASCYSNFNYGKFSIDGIEQTGSITGEIPWTPKSYLIAAGSHALRWSYTNNTSMVALTNGIWVDQVSYTSGLVAPSVATQPADVLVPQGSAATFQVIATGTPPFSYQWYSNSVSLGPLATNSVLTLNNVLPGQSGTYFVQVSNQVRGTNSQSAHLTVVPVPPGNDNFAQRTTLAGTSAVLGYTYGATKETGETNHAGVFGFNSVWWSWTAPSNGVFRLTTVATNSGGSVVAAVYTGSSVSALTGLGSGIGTSFTTNGTKLGTLSFTFNAVGGTTYAIAIDSIGGAEGFLSLSIAPTAMPILSNSTFNRGGPFAFTTTAPPGANFEILSSPDLRIWIPVATGIVPPDGVIHFSDPSAAGSYFYRLLLY